MPGRGGSFVNNTIKCATCQGWHFLSFSPIGERNLGKCCNVQTTPKSFFYWGDDINSLIINLLCFVCLSFFSKYRKLTSFLWFLKSNHDLISFCQYTFNREVIKLEDKKASTRYFDKCTTKFSQLILKEMSAISKDNFYLEPGTKNCSRSHANCILMSTMRRKCRVWVQLLCFFPFFLIFSITVQDLLVCQFMLFSSSYWLTAEDQAMSDWKMKCCCNKVHLLVIPWPRGSCYWLLRCSWCIFL